jgi:uncharacterized phage-associated protein
MSEECGDTISNLKLQKLLYYAQGFNLAVNKKPLFADKIYAWEHGPVVQTVYHQFKEHGGNSIPKPKSFDFSVFNPKEREVLDEVYRIFGQFSAWKLRNMTHEEDPWKNTARDAVITHEAMRTFFKTRVVEN